ncbi:ATP-binding cassette domain-containing protein [Zoogloea sp.]|uniref:ATP-binding cassette domain-containing protein n=1 Tax=Zoogloea sp. TaxID=49181 RepID=UPI002FE27A99
MEALRIIKDEHRNLWRIAITLDQVLADMEAEGKVDDAFLGSVFDYLEQFVDNCHHPKEDHYLFRLLRQRSPEAAAVLDRLEADHRNAPANLEALRDRLARAAGGQLPVAELAAALRAYLAGLKEHVRVEEKEVFPLATQALSAADWQEIDAAFLDNADPAFGAQAQANFRELFHKVASLAPVSVGLGAHSAGELAAPASAPGGVLLKVEGLESSYGRIKALKGISIEVRRGETVALVGANGAGKTTFLRSLSGVQPMSGRITFDGEDISRLRADMRMRRGICQSPEGRQVFGPLSIEDNLRLGAYTQPKAQVEGDLDKIYAMFPILKEKRKLPAGTLSGGQQQMLAIGRALMGRPKLLLLDEPSMGLAPLLVEEVFNVVKTLKAQGMSIILAEQNAFSALAIADRGYVLETGSVTLTGTGRELSEDEQVRAAYLGM